MDGRWGERPVKKPKIFKTYNMKMNAVDRSQHPEEICAMESFVFPSH